jgi:hypothetical protein
MNEHFVFGFVDELEKRGVWTAPGQKSLGESLPGKISRTTFGKILDRLVGPAGPKSRIGFAEMLKRTRKEEGPKAGRDVLAIARAHAKGLPGVEGHLGQKAIEEAKPSVQASRPKYMTRSLLDKLTRSKDGAPA